MELGFYLTVCFTRNTYMHYLILNLSIHQVAMHGPGEVYGIGRGDNSGYPFFRSCFRSLQVEYSKELVHNVLADATGAAFDRWLHASMLNCLDVYTRG
jgi:hypothetical protein